MRSQKYLLKKILVVLVFGGALAWTGHDIPKRRPVGVELRISPNLEQSPRFLDKGWVGAFVAASILSFGVQFPAFADELPTHALPDTDQGHSISSQHDESLSEHISEPTNSVIDEKSLATASHESPSNDSHDDAKLIASMDYSHEAISESHTTPSESHDAKLIASKDDSNEAMSESHTTPSESHTTPSESHDAKLIASKDHSDEAMSDSHTTPPEPESHITSSESDKPTFETSSAGVPHEEKLLAAAGPTTGNDPAPEMPKKSDMTSTHADDESHTTIKSIDVIEKTTSEEGTSSVGVPNEKKLLASSSSSSDHVPALELSESSDTSPTHADDESHITIESMDAIAKTTSEVMAEVNAMPSLPSPDHEASPKVSASIEKNNARDSSVFDASRKVIASNEADFVGSEERQLEEEEFIHHELSDAQIAWLRKH